MTETQHAGPEPDTETPGAADPEPAQGRDTSGRFADGNRYGKGRPPRPVESVYLARLGDALTPDRWGRIVERAIVDAENGDPKAREFIARYALGAQPLTLVDLARREQAGVTTEHELHAAGSLAAAGVEVIMLPYQTVTEGAIHLATEQDKAAPSGDTPGPRSRRGTPGIDARGRPTPALLRKVVERWESGGI